MILLPVLWDICKYDFAQSHGGFSYPQIENSLLK